MLSSLFIPWFGVVYFTSGLMVNLLQFCILPLYWIHRDTYQILTNKLAYTLFSVITFLGDWWGGIDLHLYGNEKDILMISREKSLTVINHNGDVDWLVSWVLAERLLFLERTNAFIKDIVKYIPTMGWCWWFAGWGFLKRNWKHDKNQMQNHIDGCKKNNTNYSITLFCEGTRRTKDKLKASQDYAVKSGKEPLKHHLLPRTKGFGVVVNQLHDDMTAIYDAEIAFPYPEKATVANLINGETVEVHIHLRRIPMDEVPSSTEEEAASFCSKIYKDKDDLMEYFINNRAFPGPVVNLPRLSYNLYTFVFHNIWVGGLYLAIVNYFIKLYGYTVVLSFIAILFLLVSISMRSLMRVTETNKGSSFGLKNNNNNIEKKKKLQ